MEFGDPVGELVLHSFNARMRDEFLKGEVFDTLKEAEALTRCWVDYYNTIRPHRSLGGRPPALQSVIRDFVTGRKSAD